jgi:hypothetical protein
VDKSGLQGPWFASPCFSGSNVPFSVIPALANTISIRPCWAKTFWNTSAWLSQDETSHCSNEILADVNSARRSSSVCAPVVGLISRIVMCVFGSVIKCLVIPRPIPEAPPNCCISRGFWCLMTVLWLSCYLPVTIMLLLGVILYEINLRATVSGKDLMTCTLCRYSIPEILWVSLLTPRIPHIVGSRGISGRLNPGLRTYKCTYGIHSESSYRRVDPFTNDYQRPSAGFLALVLHQPRMQAKIAELEILYIQRSQYEERTCGLHLYVLWKRISI